MNEGDVRHVAPDEVPIGHTKGRAKRDPQVEALLQSLGVPARVAVCMPVLDGPPRAPAIIRLCSYCGNQVWRSARAEEDLYILCYPCADDLMPWWND